MSDLRRIVDRILDLRPSVRDRAVLVAVSGIDGSGKGWLTARIAAELQLAVGIVQRAVDPDAVRAQRREVVGQRHAGRFPLV